MSQTMVRGARGVRWCAFAVERDRDFSLRAPGAEQIG